MDTKKPKKKIKPLTIVLICSLALLIGFASFIIYQRYFAKHSTGIFANKKADTRVVNNLDGTKVEKDKAIRHPLAVMVENHPEARPQVGLDKASIIYEAITEGGITRFMAVYGPYDTNKVGPVRSARTYYIDWLSEFNAFYVHVGGNLDALDKIKADNILDLDEFTIGDKAYWREPKAGIAIEHTMYADINKLYDIALNEKHWPKTSDFTALKFKEPLEIALRGAGQKVQINFSSESYNVVWTYEPKTNTYLREMGGEIHKDRNTQKQLASSNIIIQEMARQEATTAINESGWKMDTIGEGKVKVFSQGKEVNGTWKKANRTSRTIFYDDKGKEIIFTPGQFWIEIVPPDIYPDIKIENLNLPEAKTAN